MSEPTERGAAMRRALLAKLPPLEYHGAALLAAGLDAGSDLHGAIEVEAETFLEHLESRKPR
ncbi:MAG: hypothetical protein ABI867_08145 [Kofleriaceae bacterium]